MVTVQRITGLFIASEEHQFRLPSKFLGLSAGKLCISVHIRRNLDTVRGNIVPSERSAKAYGRCG